MRKILLVGSLIFASSVLAGLVVRSDLHWPMYDFVQYWAAGRLILDGENPYDTELVHRQQRIADADAAGIEMWNPPFALPLVMPFGSLPPRPAHIVWLLLQLAALLWSADTVWRHYGGSAELRWVALLVTCTSIPTVMALTAGQISPLLLLGATLFLRCERSGKDLYAGGAAALCAIKPHLVVLFGLAILYRATTTHRWKIVAGAAGAIAAATTLPLLLNPSVLGQYLHTLLAEPPERYNSPTAGMVLRLLFGHERFSLQFVPLVVGLLWLVWHLRRGALGWRWSDQLPTIVLVSLLTAVYGAWPFDLVLCLPAVVQVAAALQQRGSKWRIVVAVALHLAIQFAAFILVARGVEYFWFLWMTPVYLGSYLVLRRGVLQTE